MFAVERDCKAVRGDADWEDEHDHRVPGTGAFGRVPGGQPAHHTAGRPGRSCRITRYGPVADGMELSGKILVFMEMLFFAAVPRWTPD